MATLGVDPAELEAFRREFMEELARKGMLVQDRGSDGSTTDDEADSTTQVTPKHLPSTKSSIKIAPGKPKSKMFLHSESRKPMSADVSSSHKMSQTNGIQKKAKVSNPTKMLFASTANHPSILQHVTSESARKSTANMPRPSKPAAGTSRKIRRDINMAGIQAQPETSLRKFIIGADFGTTFTSVSYYSHSIEEENVRAFPDEIKSIINWPNDPMHGVNKQVPSECWYPQVPLVRQPATEQFDLSDAEDDAPKTRASSHDTEMEYDEQRVENDQSKRLDASQMDGEASTTFLWGYDVPYQRYVAHSNRDERRLIRRPKLMLVRSKHTKEDRLTLRPILDHLIQNRIIRKFGSKDMPSFRDVQDVISDFLIQVLRHTKKQLIKNERFTPECPVSFVLTVPSIWSASSSRVLQFAMETAIKATGFCNLENGSIDDLFIVSEPEAAATYLLGDSDNMLAGDTFIVLDCGGGTVDGCTYTVSNSYPLRLNNEVVRPDGDNCGASYLNTNFAEHLLERLADEHYLDSNSDNRESMVRDLIPHFEDYDKRNKDISRMPSSRVKIPGLRGDLRQGRSGDDAKRYEDNYVLLNFHDYNNIFLPLLQRVGNVLKGQLDAAISKGKEVRKVFLIGGFGAAPSLRSYLKSYLLQFSKEANLTDDVELVESDEQTCVTAVASGAILRAMNKDQGPQRFAYSSYGFLRTQPYQPHLIPGHREANPVRDEFDGELYVRAIDYFMLKRDVVPPIHQYQPFRTFHTFEVNEPRFLCEEVLYVSDTASSTSFALNSPMNRDAQVAGKIIIDMTFLREREIILPTFPVQDEDGTTKGKVHYQVEYDLVPIVEGRNLRYEARYPAGDMGKVQKAGQISIAAAFRPGTA